MSESSQDDLPEEYAQEISALISEGKDIKVSDLSNGIIDYSLKCPSGPHKNRFVYINLTADGEIIGEDVDSPDVTLGIKNHKLEGKHCQVYQRNGSYMLRDLNSSTGTWVKFGISDFVPIEDRMEIKLKNMSFIFEYGSRIEDPFTMILKKHGLLDYLGKFKSAGFDSVQRMQKIKTEEVNHLKELMGSDNPDKLVRALTSFSSDLVSGYVDRKLWVISGSDREERDWVDFTIGNKDTSTFQLSDEALDFGHTDDGLIVFEVAISFFEGRYCIFNSESNPIKDLYIRINPNKDVELRADDTIKAGNLELKVCRFNIGKAAKAEKKGDSNITFEKIYIAHDIQVSTRIDVSMIALFDGIDHVKCQRQISDRLPVAIQKQMGRVEGSAGPDTQSKLLTYIKDLLEKVCVEVDSEFLTTEFKMTSNNNTDYNTGCTCLMLLVFGDLLISANLGGNRAVLSRQGRAIHLTRDHSAYLPDELNRMLVAANGLLNEYQLRNIGPSRSFGRIELKRLSESGQKSIGPVVSITPELREMAIDYSTDEFIILGTDGVFEHLSSQEAVDFVRSRLAAMPVGNQDTQKVAEELLQHSFSQAPEGKSTHGSAVVLALTRGVIL